MTYYPKYDLVLLDIMKNGFNVLVSLFDFVLGDHSTNPYFLVEPTTFIVPARNPYDRLVSQFYHINRKPLWEEYRHTIHYSFFKSWVKETYERGYDGTDGHYFSQTHIIQYDKHPDLPYRIFKMEELIPHQLFWFVDLSEEEKIEIDNRYLELQREMSKTKHHASGNVKQGIWEIFYDSKTIEICNNYFENDFKVFGYDMIQPSEWKTPKRLLV